MRLSVRLVTLGVTGQLVSPGLFLAPSASTVVDRARRARLELPALLDQDNRVTLLLATSMIQRSSRSVAEQLRADSERLASQLRRRLRVTPVEESLPDNNLIPLPQAISQLLLLVGG